MRRIMFERSPRTYAGVGQFNWRTPKPERDLRDQEEALWKQVAKDYRTRGENHLAELSEKQAGDVEASRELLEKIIREFQEFMQQAS